MGRSVSPTHKFLHIQQQNSAKVQKSAKESRDLCSLDCLVCVLGI